MDSFSNECIDDVEKPSFFGEMEAAEMEPSSIERKNSNKTLSNSDDSIADILYGVRSLPESYNTTPSKASSLSMFDLSSSSHIQKYDSELVLNNIDYRFSKSNDSGLAQSISGSTYRNHKYDHIESKVKQYIKEMKKYKCTNHTKTCDVKIESNTTENENARIKFLENESKIKDVMIENLLEQKQDVTDKYVEAQMTIEKLRLKILRAEHQLNKKIIFLTPKAVNKRLEFKNSYSKLKNLNIKQIDETKDDNWNLSEANKEKAKMQIDSDCVTELNVDPCECWDRSMNQNGNNVPPLDLTGVVSETNSDSGGDCSLNTGTDLLNLISFEDSIDSEDCFPNLEINENKKIPTYRTSSTSYNSLCSSLFKPAKCKNHMPTKMSKILNRRNNGKRVREALRKLFASCMSNKLNNSMSEKECLLPTENSMTPKIVFESPDVKIQIKNYNQHCSIKLTPLRTQLVQSVANSNRIQTFDSDFTERHVKKNKRIKRNKIESSSIGTPSGESVEMHSLNTKAKTIQAIIGYAEEIKKKTDFLENYFKNT